MALNEAPLRRGLFFRPSRNRTPRFDFATPLRTLSRVSLPERLRNPVLLFWRLGGPCFAFSPGKIFRSGGCDEKITAVRPFRLDLGAFGTFSSRAWIPPVRIRTASPRKISGNFYRSSRACRKASPKSIWKRLLVVARDLPIPGKYTPFADSSFSRSAEKNTRHRRPIRRAKFDFDHE